MWLYGYVAKWTPLPLKIPTPTPAPLHPKIPVHLGLITFRFPHGKNGKSHFYDFGTFGRVPGSPNQLFVSLDTPGDFKRSEANPKPFLKNINSIFCIVRKIQNVGFVREDGHWKLPKILLMNT